MSVSPFNEHSASESGIAVSDPGVGLNTEDDQGGDDGGDDQGGDDQGGDDQGGDDSGGDDQGGDDQGTDGDDDLQGDDTDDDISGGDGDDNEDGGSGDDDLQGDNGDDTLAGGAGNDILAGGAGADSLKGGHGADTFVFASPTDSTGRHYDKITGFDPSSGDHIQVASAVTGIDAAVTHGSLSPHGFNTDLATALDADHLAANHAVLFTPDQGPLAGKTFLVVDTNGVAGYQAGEDVVIRLNHAAHLDLLDVTTFG
jgi:Ca2+-binding RTX toxin-like protein